MSAQEKLLVICGPTAVGKSSLAVEIAQKYDGEIVSADSRQVYKGLNIATGKISQEEKRGIPHHLLDVIGPQENFSVHDYKQLADRRISEIQDRSNLPILCGGSGFYIQAVVDDLAFPDVAPKPDLRKKLQKQSTKKLYRKLKQEDPRRAEEIDEDNPKRLIRALEIVSELGKVPKLEKQMRFDTLQIGLDLLDKQLKQNIIKRTQQRFDQGIIAEAENLHQEGMTLERMRKLGLEYKHLANYLEDKIDKEQLFENITQGDWQYAKKQRTWFQKDERIEWFNPEKEKGKIIKQVQQFIRS